MYRYNLKMGTRFKIYLTVFSIFANFVEISYGCQMEGVNNWIQWQNEEILDTFTGIFVSRSTTNILGINNIAYNDGLNNGPYMDITLSDSTFVIQTNNNYPQYEEYETLMSIGVTVVFACTGGSTASLTFVVAVKDTNNNDPLLGDDEFYEFTVMPPLAPGYEITNSINSITVRDIDLTTQRINFEIYDNSIFEITYDAASSNVAKEFRASLRTTTFIRNIPEPIEFRISATDVDLTGDPPRTRYATVRIVGNGEFVLPDELVFTETFYMATYTENNEIVLQDPISLRQGYHEQVQFALVTDAYSHYFEIIPNANDVTLRVITPIPDEMLSLQRLFLVVRADRENTSGTSATVILELPEEVKLQFERLSYDGEIVDNVLQLSPLSLTQGYENYAVTVEIQNDHASYFSYIIEQNIITLSMASLAPNIIEQNNFLILRVIASTSRSSASTIVTLNIVKDDTLTPVFERTLYSGTYDTIDGLTLEQIVLVQGYDETVEISLSGDHQSYFQLQPSGANINLIASAIPTELFIEQHILLTIEATKPRTVGASAAISIALPPEILLQFEEQNYNGIIVDNILQLSELVLSRGYEHQPFTVAINSDYASYFSHTINENRITLTMSALDSNVIEQNSFLNLQVLASTSRSSAATTVTLGIVKDDTLTPVFERAVYTGTYDTIEGLTLDQIVLLQGYDDTVIFSLKGDHQNFFEIVPSGPNINLVATTLPTELFREQHILLTIEATKPRTVGANAVVSIALPQEILLEFQQPNYNGVIVDNTLQLEDLILSQGYENEVVNVIIQNEYSSSFSFTMDLNRITLSMSPLDAIVIEQNSFFNLIVVAFTSRSSASTTVTLEIVKDDIVTPAFERVAYSGSYNPTDGLTLEPIVIVQGYDDTVELSLEGDQQSYFEIVPSGSNINLIVSSLPPELYSQGRLLLSIIARKPRTVGANAAISIDLPEARKLEFLQDTYRGTIQENSLILGTIVLSSGYADDVNFDLAGDYSNYFIITIDHNEITVSLREQLPDNVISENSFLLLSLSASAQHAVEATTTILLEIIKEDTVTPLFSQNIYVGIYSSPSNLEVPSISLAQGYDNTVSFQITGEHSEYFLLTATENNPVLTLQTAIPDDVMFREKVLLFNIIAEKPLTVGATAVISITFPTDLTEPTQLAFSKTFYTGTLDQSEIFTLENIVLNVGYATATTFTLYGDLSDYFTVSNNENVVTISRTANSLPPEILDDKFIALQLEASRERAVSVSTTVIIDIVQPEPVILPVFGAPFYRGVYTEETGLQFEQELSLSQGYDDTVTFDLSGANSQWFGITQDGNSLIITVGGIPDNVLESNHHLLFTIVASKIGADDVHATIVVDLPKEVAEAVVLRFTQPSYVGQIENNALELAPLTLEGVYDMAIQLTTTGEYSTYFRLTRESNIINVELLSDLPSQVIEENAFIAVNVEASYPDAISGFTTFVIELVKGPVTQIVTPVFEQAYYDGQYSEQGGLMFENTIQLIQGFDETVSFTLQGGDAMYFQLVHNAENSLTLSINGAAIQEVNERTHLIFSVVASKPESVTGETAIVIALTASPMRFEQDFYAGSIDDSTLTLNDIILEEGFSPNVYFSLRGEYVEYFEIHNNNNGVVELVLRSPLPSEITNNYNVLTYILEASDGNIRVRTIIVLELVKPIDGLLIFEESYYVGSYDSEGDLTFENQISLSQGYEDSVEFVLEGEKTEWFTLASHENVVTLSLSSPIPPEVVANNQQLLFVVAAKRPGSTSARATIIILLPYDVAGDQALGFDRISYVGSIQDNTANLVPIVLNEGYTPNVVFSLHGELSSYFTLRAEGPTVTVDLAGPIPEGSIPSNRLIVLEIQATDPPALPAFATIVFGVVVDEENPPAAIDIVFEETYYVGSYTATGGLAFDTPISLAEGYDSSVTFTLEGEQSQWFTLNELENGVTLSMSSTIPPAVLNNNQQLLFAVAAERPGSTSARATIIILLPDDVAGDQVLGFERISYVGSIQDNTANLVPIVLNEGYTPNVVFSLHGELSSYFTLRAEGPTVTVDLAGPILEGSIPSNRLIVLEIQATDPPALPAFATIVFGVVVDEDDPPAAIDIVFEETYYVGSYTATGGLAFDTPISLAEGYDSSVTFTLEGEQSQWFTLNELENGVTLSMSSTIPPAVLNNNQQLLFAVAAERPGSTSARATIIILLPDDVAGDQVLGFERISYVGSIQDNTANLVPIVLNEGYTPNVVFSLHGELSSYFTLRAEGPTVTVDLAGPILEGSIPSNRLIVLEIQATDPPALPAFATIVFGVVVDEDDPPAAIDIVFEETYYVGSYTATGGLAFDTPISLAEGYDSSVTFTLEGEQSQWFTLNELENGVTLSLSSTIPPAVLNNNQQLLFAVAAERPGSTSTRATIVILLPDDVAGDQVLGFDRISYVGSIQDNTANLVPIVLNEGYTPNVVFSLHGELPSYFTLRAEGPTVTVYLADPIPEGSIPSNRLIVLEIQATDPPALPAFATIVFGVVVDEDDPPAAIDIVFEETYYVGSYTATGGLAFDTPISLAEGYDSSVTFTLEGEQSQWFTLNELENGVTLSMSSTIPPAVLNNNQQLLFAVAAERPGSTSARATIIILLPDDVAGDQVLGFDRISYVGSIQDNTANLVPIVLNEGYTPNVVFSLHGELSSYFTLRAEGPTVTVDLAGPIPEGSIPSNRLIVLEIQATDPPALPAFATIVFGVVVDEDDPPAAIDIVFEETYYVGSYTATGGLAFDTPISLAEGYDSSVTFTLEGEQSQWFTLNELENGVTLSMSSTIPPAVLNNNQQLLFAVAAERPGSTSARATIIILLPDDVAGDQVLGFDRNSYVGSIQDNTANLVPIVLNEGYTPNVVFSLHGELSSYFTLRAEGPTVTVDLAGPIPEGSIPSNRLIVLEIQATDPPALPAFATIVFGVVVDEDDPPAAIDIVFEETYYVGSYTATGGLAFDTPISLAEGYDSSVTFTLEGEQSQWFTLTELENGLTLSLSSTIPPAVLNNNQQLLFAVAAERPGSTSTRATIVILLPDDMAGDQVLGFDRISYVGSIQDNTANLVPIVLNEGYTPNVVFSLHGELSSYFTLRAEGPTVTVDLAGPIPEGSIPSNRLIVLEIQATDPPALPAFATIVFGVVVDEDDPPAAIDIVFEETYYVGSYTATGGLAFDTPISLAEGYDSSVTFTLDGEQSQWFTLTELENGVTLSLSSTIPPAVLNNNQQLLFAVAAERPGSTSTRATIVILLPDDVAWDQVLGFDRISYVGSIQDNTANLVPIVLNEGYTPNVVFSLHGELSSYFTLRAEGPTVTVDLAGPIPEGSIPSNRLIVLEIQATDPPALPAFATIVFGVVVDEDDPPAAIDIVFEETYYVGSYTATGGLAFDTPISLAEGYDSSVTFTLEGEQSQWFTLTELENGVTLSLSSTIPPAVLNNNQQLLFAVAAERPGSTSTRATIVILLPDDVAGDQVLGFDRISYVGSIQDNTANLVPIVLNEGYTPNVVFSLHGELSSYFTLRAEGPTVTVDLAGPIPEGSIPSNRLIVLEIQATDPPALPAFATIVFGVVVDEDDPPAAIDIVFEETYYVGSYTAAGGLAFDTPISLAEGYDSSVTFTLEGDQSQWFTLIELENGVTLSMSSTIPPAVLNNNQQLLFAVAAERPGSTSARATIIILLPDDVAGDQVLGFDRISYVGSIQDNTANLVPIVLNEGYTPNVVFSLHGELSSYFTLRAEGRTVTVDLAGPIPEGSIPSNRLIVLEIQATDPPALPAFATIVFGVVVDEDDPPAAIDIVFEETYYVGSYTATGGLAFDTPISLAEGYDSSVTFTLEGEQSQWFTLNELENGVTLSMSSTIPPAVLNNNQQLLFAVAAERPGSTSARATIIILLPDDVAGDQVLGFDRISYVGSIQDNTANLVPIVLNEGYTPNVVFSLHGELSSYFTLRAEGRTVTVDLAGPIPEGSIPSNRLIVLEIQATDPPALPAFATIVFGVVVDEDDPPAAIDIVFEETYYVGSYTATGGLAFDTPISLAEGYDSSVTFTLEGEQSQWFTLNELENGVTLSMSSTIPPAVLNNNQQLLFAVAAERPGSTSARATIIILLPDDVGGDQVLGFDRISYVGSIQDNTANLVPIVLNEGYTPNVVFSLHGELSSYFNLRAEGPTVTVYLADPIPEGSIPSNRLIVLEIQATDPPALPAFATIVFGVVVDEDDPPAAIDIVFEETYYVGSYTATGGLAFDTPISLAEGYDSSVTFTLDGEQSQWFTLTELENGVTLSLSSTIPPAVLNNNQQLLFAVAAERPGSTSARATIIILLPDDVGGDQVLGFDRISYVGSIQDNTANLVPIVLNEGYTPNVVFSLHGELSSYFNLRAEGPTVTVYLADPIPEGSIPSNRLIVLEIQATDPPALPAFATIVFGVVVDEDDPPAAIDIVFEETYYVGSYTATGGLAFDTPISLAEGYDSSVTFTLEGEQSQWFTLNELENGVTLSMSSTIPPAVLNNNQQLLFAVAAERPGSTSARATIIILLPDDVAGDQVLGFDRISYVGSIQDNTANLVPIVLNEGYTPNVVFSLHGELSSYFNLRAEGPTVTVYLADPIPEGSIPSNRLIVLEIQATDPPALPAFATIVFGVVVDEDDPPAAIDIVFEETYYVGSYTATGGLAFDTPISLAEGYDSSVTFTLDGEQSQWFTLTELENGVTLSLSSTIPPAVLNNNQQLLFAVAAERPGSTSARATIIILLPDDVGGDQVLGFDRISYVGSIQDNTANLVPIVLNEGYTPNVVFSLHGELSSYFNLRAEGPTVTVYLADPIPEGSIPSNRLIVLEIQATDPPALPAFATIVFGVVVDEDDPPAAIDIVFEETYYVGSYTATGGLAFDTPISLAEGYDSSVTFTLEGEQSQWFTLNELENGVTLSMSSTIPPAVLNNNQQLLFAVAAERPGSTSARATIIILLPDDVAGDQVLGFDRISYVGSIQDNTANLVPIVLNEGYTPNVVFSLHGELSSYFNLRAEGPTVTVYLADPIPEGSIPSNRLIVLEIQATDPPALPAFATIVFGVVVDEDDPPAAIDIVFEETYYVGSYTATGGLAFDTPISLAEGYDSSVTFTLEGEQSQWFTLNELENGVTLSMSSTIPPAVLNNNQQLLFAVAAERPGSTSARATIIILLPDDVAGDQVLGFDRISYVGSIQDNTANLVPIVLNEGYTPNVVFSLHGELSSYFNLRAEGPTVTVYLADPIPEGSIPSNRLIVLEIQATDPPALPAFATIVFGVVVDEDDPPAAIDIVFEETYYVGSYTATGGLAFDTPISLAEGYDLSVTFTLEGEQSQWFTLTELENGVTLSLSSTIPPSVLNNNQQLLFAVAAERPGSTSTRATIVILLPDDVGGDQVLGFDRISYVGSIQDNTANLVPIVLNEGYTPNVVFSLHGELSSYFTLRAEGPTVTVDLAGPIPEGSIPSNRLIVLEIQATEPPALPAYATIVFEVVLDGDDEDHFVTFGKVLYEGRVQGGVVQHEAITISGYEGDHLGITGIYGSLFSASHSNGVVSVHSAGTQTLPIDVQHVVLELHADNAAAVLILDITGTDPPEIPSVTFSSASYVIRAETSQTGAVGKVEATADNGESITYSLQLDNDHLLSRLTITNDGELRLSAPTENGVYNFQVVATTRFTGATASATVDFSVETADEVICEDNIVTAPLIVINRDEEEAYRDLVVLNTTQHASCHYSLANLWPADQSWLYVDETGLHAQVIDREDPSIAFMALSQVQVELTLNCDSDATRTKRSISSRNDWLGPYDYGTNTWLLGNTIEYNRRKTIVNLIVNDINDNSPIFIGKENEPIVIGYPVSDFESAILPRSLIEVKATDADVGENAALVYWSSEQQLAVSPTTGFVHLRNDAELTQDMQLVISATDLNGQGLTGTITLMVKLLKPTNIAVVTVQDAFLEDEGRILSNLSTIVGYEVKSLRSVVVSDSGVIEELLNRNKRQVAGITGASLEIYVYGLENREPVTVEKLSEDITSNAEVATITVVRILTLEEYLESQLVNNIGRDTGLLVATIVLSVLLFIFIVAAVVWFLLKRRKDRNYEQFDDSNSLASQIESPVTESKPDNTPLHRLNLEELKRSERRLQDMLKAPISEASVEPTTSAINAANVPVIDPMVPIVVQDRLKDVEESDDDEFGERKKARRKSVVTFNENVEKIITVDDNPDATTPELEIYQL